MWKCTQFQNSGGSCCEEMSTTWRHTNLTKNISGKSKTRQREHLSKGSGVRPQTMINHNMMSTNAHSVLQNSLFSSTFRTDKQNEESRVRCMTLWDHFQKKYQMQHPCERPNYIPANQWLQGSQLKNKYNGDKDGLPRDEKPLEKQLNRAGKAWPTQLKLQWRKWLSLMASKDHFLLPPPLFRNFLSRWYSTRDWKHPYKLIWTYMTKE